MKKVVALFIIVLAVTGIYGFYWANKPAVSKSINNLDTDVKGAQTQVVDVQTDLFKTKISSDFVLKTQNTLDNEATSRQFVFAHKNVYFNGQIAITIGTDKTHDLSDISGVKLRQINTEEYNQLPSSKSLNIENIVFSKKSTYEKSVFWLDNGNKVSLVASGGFENQSTLDENLDTILRNWQWL
jgi:hypothetical protein